MADGGPLLVAGYHQSSTLPIHRRHHDDTPLAAANNTTTMAASSSASPPMYVGTVFGGVGTALAYGAPPAPALSSMVPNPLLAQQQQQQQQRLGDDEPSQLALHLFKNLKDKRGVTRDGQPAKKRGPKPDSKPAMSRRQELNRQAQRYVKMFQRSLS